MVWTEGDREGGELTFKSMTSLFLISSSLFRGSSASTGGSSDVSLAVGSAPDVLSVFVSGVAVE